MSAFSASPAVRRKAISVSRSGRPWGGLADFVDRFGGRRGLAIGSDSPFRGLDRDGVRAAGFAMFLLQFSDAFLAIVGAGHEEQGHVQANPSDEIETLEDLSRPEHIWKLGMGPPPRHRARPRRCPLIARTFDKACGPMGGQTGLWSPTYALVKYIGMTGQLHLHRCTPRLPLCQRRRDSDRRRGRRGPAPGSRNGREPAAHADALPGRRRTPRSLPLRRPRRGQGAGSQRAPAPRAKRLEGRYLQASFRLAPAQACGWCTETRQQIIRSLRPANAGT